MRDWLGEDHFVWFLLDAVEQMDLWAFHAAHRSDGKGQKAHHPSIMLPVLLYGYCHGERSSCQLERLCQESVPCRILASDTAPDHCAFARFRQRHEAAWKEVFVEVLRLCAEANLREGSPPRGRRRWSRSSVRSRQREVWTGSVVGDYRRARASSR